jgi:DNA-binding NarL/FixJ family response regulator
LRRRTVKSKIIEKPEGPGRARLLLADDHQILLEGIRNLLEPEFDVAGTAVDGRELVAMSGSIQPDVVVLDIGMPLLNGIEAARQIRHNSPKSRIVVLTQQTAKPYIREAFGAGASAYVLKHSAARELTVAIRRVLKGEYYVSDSLRDAGINMPLETEGMPAFRHVLTSRQREVLQLVAEGKAAKEIAAILGISIKTVEFHKAAIMEQLGMRTIAELTRYAVAQGIVQD